MKRPLSIWLTQALLGFGILQLSIWVGVGLFLCLLHGDDSCLAQSNLLLFWASLCSIVFLIAAFWGLQTRKRYGKWLGMIFLVILLVGGVLESSYFQLVYSSITQGKPLPTPPYECWDRGLTNIEYHSCGYSSYLDLAFRGLLDVLFPQILVGLLAVRLLSSRASHHFFTQKVD